MISKQITTHCDGCEVLGDDFPDYRQCESHYQHNGTRVRAARRDSGYVLVRINGAPYDLCPACSAIFDRDKHC